MTESRFPNKDEIAALRLKGQVAVSSFVCRLGSGICLILFILNADVESKIKQLLSARDLDDAILLEAGSSLSRILFSAVALYLCAFALMALLQSRFYLQPGRVFRRTAAVFDLSRGFSFFRISSWLGICGLGLFMLSAVYLWREFFFSELGIIIASEYGISLSILKAISLKLAYFLFGVLFVFMTAVFVYSRISFMIRHRVAAKRG